MTSRPGRDQERPRVVLGPEIAEIAGSITNRTPDLVDRVVRRILTEIEFYRDRGVVSLEDLRGSVRSNLESMGPLLPDAELHVYHGGHLGLLTEAAELAPVVDRFLGRDSRPTEASA